MSWMPDLQPLRPRDVWRDLRECHVEYRYAGIPARQRFVFLVLRLLQRLAYFRGWQEGRRLNRAARRARKSRG